MSGNISSVPGSQESLPLSEESCLLLFQQLEGPLTKIVDDITITDGPNNQAYPNVVAELDSIAARNMMNEENVKTEIEKNDTINSLEWKVIQDANQFLSLPAAGLLDQRGSPSTLPDSENWPGYCNFNSLLKCQENTKGASWIEDPDNWKIIQDTDQFLNLPSTNVIDHRRPPSALPASENWPGDFNFSVSFKRQENIKGANWIFSKERNKLYVGRDVPCPINFSTSIPMPDDVSVRAMALFSSSDHASESVTRCVNHSMNELDKEIFEAEHLIRCESDSAHYEVDSFTSRHSVVVPFENPAEGQQFSSYIYKFMCFGSCAGGPNRRPLMLVFTLERGGKAIGRQRIDLKICACPGRDYRSDEKLLKGSEIKEAPVLQRPDKRPVQEDISDITPDAFLTNSLKKLKPEHKTTPFTIKVYDRKCYEFLKEMRRYFKIFTMIKRRYPTESDFKCLIYSSQSSDQGGE